MAHDGSDTPKRPGPVRGGLITRTPKWLLLAGFWLCQAVLLYHLQAFLYLSQGEVEASEDNFLGVIPELAQFVGLAYGDPEFVVSMLVTLVVLTVAQGLLLLPARRPGFALGKGKNLRTSLVIAGFSIGVLVLGAVAVIAGFLEAHDLGTDGMERHLPGGMTVAAIGVVLAGWAVATPLLIAFSRRGPREDVLSRLSRRLLVGTMVEVALLIPLDVMVRRRTDCYCWSGSYWGLTLCGAVGMLFAGPAIFLPLLSKHRRTWYTGHCGVCGYDMSGDPTALRCPECGTGWKAGSVLDDV